MGDFPGVFSHIHPELNDVTGEHLTGRTLLRPAAQTLAVDEGPIAAFGVLEIKLSCLVVEPHQSVIPRQHFAVEGGVVLGRATPGHGAPDLDRLIQVNMAFLKRV